jgi:hypothetical protein
LNPYEYRLLHTATPVGEISRTSQEGGMAAVVAMEASPTSADTRRSDARCSLSDPGMSRCPIAGQSVRSTITKVMRQGVSATKECVAFGAR